MDTCNDEKERDLEVLRASLMRRSVPDGLQESASHKDIPAKQKPDKDGNLLDLFHVFFR